jgi:hypothetical protein
VSKDINEIIAELPAERRARIEARARDLMQEVAAQITAKNARLTCALRQFIAWFEANQHDLREIADEDYSVFTTMSFYDLQDIADAAREALK